MKRSIPIALALVAANLVVYGQVRNSHFVNFDDQVHVYDTPYVQDGMSIANIAAAFTESRASSWFPLANLSHLLDVEFFGLRPGGHHLVSLFFHIANTLLLFFVLARMTGARWQCAAVAALFAVRLARHAPYLIVGWLWFLGTLVPVIGLVQVGSHAYANRYTYVPLVSIFIMIVWGLPELLARWPYRRTTLALAA